ncbi:MAG: CAP domain-containing protein [Nitrospiraceae bacterium]|nr:CAP domain-containing protein [Nitrospiraceae bacterium]
MTVQRPSSEAGFQPRLAVLLLCCLILSAFSCRPAAPPGYPPVSRKPKPSVSVSRLEKEIHSLINRERRKQGLSSLAFDDALARVARGHSTDMGKRRYFSHESPQGHDFAFRYRQAGYQCALRQGATIHLGAENIAQNNLYTSVTTVNGSKFYDWSSEEEIAASTVKGWMDSPGHRKNILTPFWEKEGIGVFIAPDDKVYITQNFC